MNLFVTRHGETEYNVQRRYSGSTDIPLSKKGLTQALELAESLRKTKFDVVVSSPLLRAKKTAEAVCAVLNMNYEVFEEFSERCFGVYEGLTGDEIKIKYPELWANNSTRQLHSAPDGGESYQQFFDRVDRGMKRLKELYSDKSVLIVCHAGTALAIHRFCHKLTFNEALDFVLDNCEVMHYIQ